MEYILIHIYTKLNDLVIEVRTASIDHENVSWLGNTQGNAMAMRHVEANMDVTLSNLTYILPRPKFGKRGVPVLKTRNCLRVSLDAVCKNSIKYH